MTATAPTPPETDPRQPPQRRRRAGWAVGLVTTVLLAGAAAGSWFGAREAARQIETRSVGAVRLALADRHDWAGVAADGLQLILSGTAPDEGARLRVMAEAARVVDPGRIMDRMEVAPRTPAAPPAFKVELLRNDAGLSIIGLVPGDEARRRLTAQMAALPGKPVVTDMLESAAYDAPAHWDSALRFGGAVIADLARAKVSIAPGVVSVTAIADSPRDKARVEAALRRQKPADVTLTMAITAPRPVITPFTLRFVRDEAGARFDACAVESEDARRRVLEAALAAGAPAGGDCTLGIGAPSPQWADAVVAGLGTVGALGAGAVTFTDAAVTLDVPATVPQDAFDAAVAGLERALPPAFHLAATLEGPASAESTPDSARFTVGRAANGPVTLRGRVADARMRNVVESFARARFTDVETAGLRIDPAVPDGWTLRLIGALEALEGLGSGSAEVTPQMIRIAGVSGNSTASAAAAVALGRRLGPGADYSLAIRYDRRQDPALNLPTGQDCVDRANAVMATSEIGFEPAKAEIAGDVAPTLAALKSALTDCQAFRIEIGGHTDSQGSGEFNQALSLGRAEAVLAALREAGIDTAGMSAAGYGESQPVATNDTDAGREANRRIEFRLVSPDPVDPPVAPAAVVSGVTAEPADGVASPGTGQGALAIEGNGLPAAKDAVNDAATGTAMGVVRGAATGSASKAAAGAAPANETGSAMDAASEPAADAAVDAATGTATDAETDAAVGPTTAAVMNAAAGVARTVVAGPAGAPTPDPVLVPTPASGAAAAPQAAPVSAREPRPEIAGASPFDATPQPATGRPSSPMPAPFVPPPELGLARTPPEGYTGGAAQPRPAPEAAAPPAIGTAVVPD